MIERVGRLDNFLHGFLPGFLPGLLPLVSCHNAEHKGRDTRVINRVAQTRWHASPRDKKINKITSMKERGYMGLSCVPCTGFLRNELAKIC